MSESLTHNQTNTPADKNTDTKTTETVDEQSGLLNTLRISSGDRSDQATNEQKTGASVLWLALLLLLSVLATGYWHISEWPLRESLNNHVKLAANESWQNTSPVTAEQPTKQLASPEPRPSPSVSTATSILDATGYITARRQATVSAKITGRIDAVLVEEGDYVRTGDLLARLDDSLQQARFRLSQSQYSAAQSSRVEIEVDRIAAKRTLERVSLLFSQSLVSQTELDQASTALDAVYARLSHSSSQIIVAKNRMLLQQQHLTDTEIRAPFDAVVISKAAQAGEVVSPSFGGSATGSGICYLVDMSSLEIEVDVNEANINRVFTGQRVVATVNSYRDWQIPAQVITIIPSADRNRATVKVRIKMLQTDQRILPDMSVKVAFFGAAKP